MINKAGDVIIAQYSNLNGTLATGLFLIIYDEATDNLTQHGNNVIALKITTSVNSVSSYYVNLDLEKNKFFDKQCYVVCNKPITLNKAQITSHLGRITKMEILKVYNQTRNYINQMESQILGSIMGIGK